MPEPTIIPADGFIEISPDRDHQYVMVHEIGKSTELPVLMYQNKPVMVTLPELNPKNEPALVRKLQEQNLQGLTIIDGPNPYAYDAKALVASLRSAATKAGHGDFAYNDQQRNLIEFAKEQLGQHPEYALIASKRVFIGVGDEVNAVFGKTGGSTADIFGRKIDNDSSGEALRANLWITIPKADFEFYQEIKNGGTIKNTTCTEELLHTQKITQKPNNAADRLKCSCVRSGVKSCGRK